MSQLFNITCILELHVHRYESCVTDAQLNTVSFECTSWKIVDLLKSEWHRLNKQTNKMNRTVRSEQVKFLFMVADGMLRQITTNSWSNGCYRARRDLESKSPFIISHWKLHLNLDKYQVYFMKSNWKTTHHNITWKAK